jgi:hypothetical protein
MQLTLPLGSQLSDELQHYPNALQAGRTRSCRARKSRQRPLLLTDLLPDHPARAALGFLTLMDDRSDKARWFGQAAPPDDGKLFADRLLRAP